MKSPKWSSARMAAGEKVREGGTVYFVLTTAGIIQHELMHVLGFSHEQNRRDRERYIRINYENIRPGVRRNFDIFPDGLLCSHYDYCSVMHYSSTAFSVSYLLQQPGPLSLVEECRGSTLIGR